MEKSKIKNVIATTGGGTYKVLILVATFLFTTLYTSQLQAQELGTVWDRKYGDDAGKIGNIYPDKNDENYTAIGVEGNYIGKIYEINESGTVLRTFTVDVRTGAYKTKQTNFTGVTLEAGIAFKTNDGGVLAFFSIYDTNGSDKQVDWNGKSNQLKNGLWVIKFNEDGTVENDKIDRGTAVFDGLQLSDGRLMVGGLDADITPLNGDGVSRGVTLLRIYDQDGAKTVDFRGDNPSISQAVGSGFNIKEVVSIHMDSQKNPDGSDRVLIATILYLARIDDLTNTTAPTISYALNGVSLPTSPVVTFNNPNVQSMTPALDGGIFVETLIANDWRPATAYTGGRALVKFTPQGNSFTPVYARVEKPQTVNNSELKYDAPYLLPSGVYGGLVQYKANINGGRKSYIYELNDFSTQTPIPNPPYEINPTPGTPIDAPASNSWAYLNGELLVKRSSKVNGFFAVGTDFIDTPNMPNIIKLSTCANFYINNIPQTGYYFIKPRATFTLDQTFRYQGAAAPDVDNVKYSMTVSVLSGIVENKTAGDTLYYIPLTSASTFADSIGGAVGDMMTIHDAFTISGDQPVVQYTITSEDHYKVSGQDQVCQQTTVFYLVQELYGGTAQGPLYAASGSALSSPIYVENASGGFGANTYQWQEYIGGDWVDIPDATDATYLPSETFTANREFRRNITNSVGTKESTSFTVNVINLPDIDIVSLPTGVIEGNNLVIKTAIKNISPKPTISPFKITVYKGAKGSSINSTFTDDQSSILEDETRHYEIVIPNYVSDPNWNGAGQIIVSFNDAGNALTDQPVYNSDNLPSVVLNIKN